MPIPLPNLDDRTYADLVEEMRDLIPRYAPEWTDHNESDPGIMLVEMFVWLTEALLYRTNRVTEKSEHRLLALLDSTLSLDGNQLSLHEKRARILRKFQDPWRAITTGDFEQLLLSHPCFKLARVKCLPERDLTAVDPYTPRPGHITVIIVPTAMNMEKIPIEQLLIDVWDFLEERRLITCRHHVVGPAYSDIKVEAEIVRTQQIAREALAVEIDIRLKEFFDPLTGGPQKTGWLFGHGVYASEVYQVIEGTPGVDHVEALMLFSRNDADAWQPAVSPVIQIPSNNLVRYVESGLSIRV